MRIRAQRAGNCMIKKYPAKILWHRRLENLDLLFRYGENFDDFSMCFVSFGGAGLSPSLNQGGRVLKCEKDGTTMGPRK